MGLQSAATLLLARHGESGAEGDRGVLSDEGGSLTGRGRAQGLRLAAALADRRVAAVYSSPLGPAVECAELVGSALGVPVIALEGLEELRVGGLRGLAYDDPRARSVFTAWGRGHLEERVPGGESGTELVGRLRDALQHLADLHRGETVLVVSHGGVLALALPHLATGAGPDLAASLVTTHGEPVELEVGDDGWRLRPWSARA